VTYFLGDLLADQLRLKMRDKVCHESALLRGLEVAHLFRLLDRGLKCLLMALGLSLFHAAVVRGADLLWHLLAPGLRLAILVLCIGRVALGLKPRLAHSLGLNCRRSVRR
jgi:hypothetical protein